MPKSFSESKCGIQLSQAAAGILSKTELNQLFGQIDHQRLQTQASKAVSNVAGKFLDQHAYQASLDRRTAIFNKMRQTEMISRLREWIKQGVPAGKAEAGMVAGDSGRSGLGFQDNPADRRDKMQRREQILIHSQLKKEKLEKYAMAPGYDAAVDEAQERQNTIDPQAKSQLPMTEYGKLKPHEQKAVERIAELYNQQLDRLRGNASNVGALISKPEGYMGEQTHEKGRIRNADRAGKNFIHDMPTEEARRAWSKDMDGWLDMDKTRANLVKQGRLGVLEDLDPAKFKDRLWDIFAGGPRRGGTPEGAREAGAKMGSGGNLLAEAEKARVLEFKDAKSFSAYRAKYGKGSKWISHLGQIDNMAHTIETLRTFGPSPENNFMKARETVADELSRQKDEIRTKAKPSDLADSHAAAHAVLKLAEQHKAKFLNDVRDVGQGLGLELPRGVEKFATKTPESLDTKLKLKPGKVPTDLLRTTLVSKLGRNGLHDQAIELLKKMESKGYKLYAPKGRPDAESKHAEKRGYKDIAFKFEREGDPVIREVQILQPEMLEAKSGRGHELYDDGKKLTEQLRREKDPGVKAGFTELLEKNKSESNDLYDEAYRKDNPDLYSESGSGNPSEPRRALTKSPLSEGGDDFLSASSFAKRAATFAGDNTTSATERGLSLVRSTSEYKSQLAERQGQADATLLKVQNNLDSMSQGAKDGKVSTGHRYLADYLGSDPVGHKSWWDHLTDAIMAFERVTNLGGSLFSALPSFYTSALESSRYGGGILPAAARTTIGATTNLLHKSFGTLFGILGSLPPTEKMEWARQYGVGMDAAHGQIKAAVLGRQQWAPGSTWAKFENKFFNLVGLPQFLDSVGTQHVADISGKIARQFGNTFDKLPPEMARTLRDYNISPQEWELIRKYTGHEFNNLHTVVSADGMREAPLDEVKSTLGVKSDFAANAAKQDIEDKLASLHADSADIGRVFHNFKTGQIIKGLVGDSPLSRLTMQFATFNFAHGQRVLWRHYNERSKMDFAFKVLGGLTLTGMLAYTARQILQGKNPTANPELYDNSDPSKMGEAWAKYAGAGAGQAGVGGMVGDLLFSQTYDNGRGSALQPLAGPAGDDAMQLFQFAHDATGKGKIDSDQMLKFAQGKTPFANVWWIKPLINYGMMYGIHENLNPGTLERSEQHAKQSGDPYWAPPSQYANRP